MAAILCIESATKNCSVALSVDGNCVALVEENSDKFIHAEKLHSFIERALREAKITLKQIDAVAVSNGPGSYTGLRIGVSAAKGLCFALNKPMIALNTNDVLANATPNNSSAEIILSVIDARRNEVYARTYSATKTPLSEIEAVELDENSYQNLVGKSLFIVGDAAEKTAQLLNRKDALVLQEPPTAKHMCLLANTAFLQTDFVDVAYHEPFYLKDFIAGKPKKLL